MDLQLKDKLIIVSGGAKGIGKSIVEVLAKEGALPIIVGRNHKDNLELVTTLKNEGYTVDQVVAELTDPSVCKAVIDQIAHQYGRIDGIVNNAGINDGVGLESGDYDRFMLSLHRNLVHYYLLVHHALPWLKLSKGPIVNISSKTAETGQGNTSAYAASNGGRNALTREWAVELAKYSIRVNAVVVAESYTPLYEKWINSLPDGEQKKKQIEASVPFESRFTKPEEIANMVVFLLSPASSHTTGQLIHVDGGYVHLDRAMNK